MPLARAEQALQRDFSGVVRADDAGQVISSGAYGWANAAMREPMTTEHRLRIGSLTKTFTSALVAHLHTKGRLRLDDSLARYIPGFPWGHEITLRHLIAHRSGVGDLTQDDYHNLLLRPDSVRLDEVVELLRRKKPRFRPGARQEYSNAGYLLLGRVIEVVMGSPYVSVLQDEMLRPLGLAQTGFASFDKDVVHLAVGHASGMKADPQRYNYSAILPAGGLFSTAQDMLTWCHALDQVGIEGIRDGESGWTTGTRYGRPAAWHAGNTNTYSALLVRFPATRGCFVALSNERRRGIPGAVRDLAAAAYSPPPSP